MRPLDGDGSRDRPRPAPGRATVVAWVLPHLFAHVAARGHDTAPLRRLPGLRGCDLEDPEARIPDGAAREAWRLATELTGDDALGLHMAESVPAGALDLLEYAFRSSTTLATGLEQLARYGRVTNDRGAARVERTDAGLRVVLGDPRAEPLQPQRADAALAYALRLAREATGCAVVPASVSFAHPAPETTFEHRRFFRAPLTFGAAAYEIVLRPDDAALPLRSADPALAGIVRRRLDRLVPHSAPEGDPAVASRVREVLFQEAGRSEPSSSAVARELGMSPRTLARRLAAEGTSFREVLDRLRQEAAVALLREGRMGIGEIAFLLGYSEPAAFHRSFKRWTGKTPLSWRRDLRAA